jgi:hypothetical protein
MTLHNEIRQRQMGPCGMGGRTALMTSRWAYTELVPNHIIYRVQTPSDTLIIRFTLDGKVTKWTHSPSQRWPLTHFLISTSISCVCQRVQRMTSIYTTPRPAAVPWMPRMTSSASLITLVSSTNSLSRLYLAIVYAKTFAYWWTTSNT